MARDQKIAALYKTVKIIRKKLFNKLNHIISSTGKTPESIKSSRNINHNCIQAQIDLLKTSNTNNNNDASSGPDFKIYDGDWFLASTPRQSPRERISSDQLPRDFFVDNIPGDCSVDYINIWQSPPPPLPPRRTLSRPPPVFRKYSVTDL